LGTLGGPHVGYLLSIVASHRSQVVLSSTPALSRDETRSRSRYFGDSFFKRAKKSTEQRKAGVWVGEIHVKEQEQ
jgi:hypothetical protein